MIDLNWQKRSLVGTPHFLNKVADVSIRTSGKHQASCPVRQDLLKNPVTCNCGQSFCSSFVLSPKGSHSCPQCGEMFTPKPRTSIKVDDLLERMKKVELPSSNHRSDPSFAEPGDVECDECTGRKLKAVKSCLMCLASFCESHLIPHTTVQYLKRHKLIEASSYLKENTCSQHDKLNEFYCRTDQKCICALCALNEHKGHDTVEADTERTGKQTEIAEKRREVQQRIKDKQKELDELKQFLDALKCSAQTALEENEKIFIHLIHTIEKTRSEVAELIRVQEKMEHSRVAQLHEQLEKEIAELHKRDAELQKLLNTDNNVYFLQHFRSLSLLSASVNSPSLAVSQHIKPDLVRKSLSDLNMELQKFGKEEYKIISNVTNFQLRFPSEPKTSEDCLQYYQKFTLDITTAHNELRISENNREATCRETIRPYIQHPNRFDFWPQVLCRESVSGHCYWEVEWEKGIYGVYVAVSYKGVGRKGHDRVHWFGHNSQSWSLECSPTPCIWHDNNKTEIYGPLSSKIGVYVDYKAGTLCFYDISDKMTLLHRVQTTFSQPLYPGFWFSMSSSVTLCDL
ncbi:tripartite motif-containing protein 16-like [Garra rufa]|uniref:tripartite motif-containing protein 16-like n=1 Tax=Garra rufa TaxID=137080 RepID=UPI003CCEBF3C